MTMSASSTPPIVSPERGGADHGLRASEAEREDTVAMLHRAMGAGSSGSRRGRHRIAALVAALALEWISLCALLGAASVAT
jgi:hypothetical protein